MNTTDTTNKQPLWFLIEEKILELSSGDLNAAQFEQTIAQTAQALDDTGYNVSRTGGNLLQLRWALNARIKVGRPMMEDFKAAVEALKLEDVSDPRIATYALTERLGDTWPKLMEYDRRTDIIKMIEKTRLDLYTARAKELGGDEGIRYLIADGLAFEVIIDRMGISEDEFKRVDAAVKAELAEIARVKALFEEAEGKSDEDKVKKLIKENVTDELMIEVCGLDQTTIDGVKKSMEEELKEKQRLAEEEAARKKAEAEGPTLENMSNDDIIAHIESIRDIMDFTDKPEEIKTMAEQSKIPKAIIDVAVAGSDELDKLEKKANG